MSAVIGSDFFCLLCKNISLLAEVSHGMTKKCTARTVLASTGVFLTTSKVLITCDTTYRTTSFPGFSPRSVRWIGENPGNEVAYKTSLHNDNCGLRNIQHGVSTGRAHSTINETSSENQSVSATNICSRRLHGRTRWGPTEVFLYPLLILLLRETC